jgi:hypothetical protein
LRGCICASSTIGRLVGYTAAVLRRGVLLGPFTMLFVVVGDGDAGRGGHGDFGGQDGGARFGSNGDGLCAGGAGFGSG